MKEFTKENIAAVSTDLRKILKTFGEERGISFKVGGITYGSGTFTCKLTGNAIDGVPREAEDYDRYKKIHGLPERGTRFNSGKKRFEVVGYNTRAGKNKILLLDHTSGRNFHCSIDHLLYLVTMDKR